MTPKGGYTVDGFFIPGGVSLSVHVELIELIFILDDCQCPRMGLDPQCQELQGPR